jgi:tRNA (guanine-N7-)-methyltransferase
VAGRGGCGEQRITRAIDETWLVKPGENLPGPLRWPEIFGEEGPLTVEIGFGKDEFLLDLAGEFPDRRFLAIDFSRSRGRSYMNKIARRGLRNVRVMLDHAANIVSLCLPTAGVEEYFVLFPDPWPKDRHAANRLVRPWFAREVARTLLLGGRITLATDDQPYRDQIIEVFESHGGFRNRIGPGQWGPRPLGFEGTIFERRWIEKGRNIHYMHFERERES